MCFEVADGLKFFREFFEAECHGFGGGDLVGTGITE